MSWTYRVLYALGIVCPHVRPQHLSIEQRSRLADMERQIDEATVTHTQAARAAMHSNFRAQDQFLQVTEAVRGVVTLLEKKQDDE